MATSIHEILFPTDLSPAADQAFEHARFLAERFHAFLTLYHAVQVPDHQFAHWAFAHDHDIWMEAERRAKERLVRRAETLAVRHCVVVERRISVCRSLVETMRARQPDLTVLTTHGREGLAHLLLGSIAEDVVQHAFRPILCLREPEHGCALPYRRILVPTDLSFASCQAFPMAALFARTFSADVVALHVVPPAALRSMAGSPSVDAPEGSSVAEVARFCRTEFAELPLSVRVATGVVWDRICKAAGEERADLIVMATRGHDSLADRILGSNTERVARHAPCPVLIA
jgi:nucleotide-binding universal stress UspA family protein